MAIVVDTATRLVVQGLTGSEGRFHGLRNRAYGTELVAGVTPGKGGQDVEGVPVFDTVYEAVRDAAANTSMIFVPAPFAADAVYEAIDAGITTVIVITEHVPAHEMLRIKAYVDARDVTLIGPNCPGVLSPGKANVGIIPGEIFAAGSIGLVSRSGTLTYQIGHELTQLGLGNSTIVGIGGDPVVGSSFIDMLRLFEGDPEPTHVVRVGEIGGDEEEKAAAFIEAEMSKPVVSYIAGFTAPAGETMGHAGAIIPGGSGTAQAKQDALEAKGIRVGTTPTETAQLVAELVRG
jgi:succinyl-CoA synthetase alpha subunit